MNKKGLETQFVVLIVMGLAIFSIMLLWWAWSIFAPPFVSTVNTAVTAVQQANPTENNISNAINNTIVPASRILINLEWISYFLPISLFVMLLLMASFVRTYPFLLPIWLAIVVILIFISILLANGYQTSILNNPDYNYVPNNFLMSYLPHIITVIGFIGGVFLLVLISKDNTAQVTI